MHRIIYNFWSWSSLEAVSMYIWCKIVNTCNGRKYWCSYSRTVYPVPWINSCNSKNKLSFISNTWDRETDEEETLTITEGGGKAQKNIEYSTTDDQNLEGKLRELKKDTEQVGDLTLIIIHIRVHHHSIGYWTAFVWRQSGVSSTVSFSEDCKIANMAAIFKTGRKWLPSTIPHMTV